MNNYDVDPRRGDFVTVRRDTTDAAADELRVIFNWSEELKAKVK